MKTLNTGPFQPSTYEEEAEYGWRLSPAFLNQLRKEIADNFGYEIPMTKLQATCLMLVKMGYISDRYDGLKK